MKKDKVLPIICWIAIILLVIWGGSASQDFTIKKEHQARLAYLQQIDSIRKTLAENRITTPCLLYRTQIANSPSSSFSGTFRSGLLEGTSGDISGSSTTERLISFSWTGTDGAIYTTTMSEKNLKIMPSDEKSPTVQFVLDFPSWSGKNIDKYPFPNQRERFESLEKYSKLLEMTPAQIAKSEHLRYVVIRMRSEMIKQELGSIMPIEKN